MTRKLPAVFALSLVISFFLLLGVLGKQGLLCNMSLKHELEAVRYRKTAIGLQVDSLQAQEREIRSGEGLRDAAFKIGYLDEGDRVYYFGDDRSADPPDGPVVPNTEKSSPARFEGFSATLIFLMALAFSVAFTVFFMVVVHRRDERDDEYGRREGVVPTDSWDD